MVTTKEYSKTRRHELRLAFYDFTLRGEGERMAISAAIEHWRAAGALAGGEADRWQEALEWREAGGLLPGWTLPRDMIGLRDRADDADLAAFEAWRAGRDRARAA